MYLYNGKELNTDFGLGWADYGFRWYDASIGRWHSVDLLAEGRVWTNPYNFVQNNPISRFDPDGLTDYTINAETGDVQQIGDKTKGRDRVLKTDSDNNVLYKKNGKRGKGKPKVEFKVAKGILEDGMNLATDDTFIPVNGKGQPTTKDVETFAVNLSEYIGKEVNGTTWTTDGNGENNSHVSLGRYKSNTETRSNYHGTRHEIKNKFKELGLDPTPTTSFHVHPTAQRDRSVVRRASRGDRDRRDALLIHYPTMKFYILYRPYPADYGIGLPARYDYTNN